MRKALWRLFKCQENNDANNNTHTSMISIEIQIQTSNLLSPVLLQLKDNFKNEMIKFMKSSKSLKLKKKTLKNRLMERQKNTILTRRGTPAYKIPWFICKDGKQKVKLSNILKIEQNQRSSITSQYLELFCASTKLPLNWREPENNTL